MISNSYMFELSHVDLSFDNLLYMYYIIYIIYMIKKVKIFGERNSGTTFITNLIEINITNIAMCSSYYLGGTGWKHGTPKIRFV